MSEEEKKAIEWLKKAEFFSERLYAPIILNLIDKQQNQIERLKKDKEILYGVIDELKEDNDGDHIPRID